VVEFFCYEFFIWCWCFFNYRCNVIVMFWVIDIVVSGVWEIVRWEDICIIGIIDLVEAAVVEVVPPLAPVDTEEFSGSFVSMGVLVKISGVDTLASAAALVTFEVNTPFEVLWKIVELSSSYGFISVNESTDYVYCHQVVFVT
jgi:hypothetical protein